MNSTRTSRSTTARRAGSLSIAGALACLALAPTITHADQVTSDGGASARSSGTDGVIAARWGGCDIPQSLDDWSRRLIAVQVCARAQLVPARTLARVAFSEPIPEPDLASASVGHCGHEALHRPSAASGLPVSAWFTPTSC